MSYAVKGMSFNDLYQTAFQEPPPPVEDSHLLNVSVSNKIQEIIRSPAPLNKEQIGSLYHMLFKSEHKEVFIGDELSNGARAIYNLYKSLKPSAQQVAIKKSTKQQGSNQAVILKTKTEKTFVLKDSEQLQANAFAIVGSGPTREKLAFLIGGEFAGVPATYEITQDDNSVSLQQYIRGCINLNESSNVIEIIKTQQLHYRRIIILRLLLLDMDLGLQNILIKRDTQTLVPIDFGYILPSKLVSCTRDILSDLLDDMPFTDEEQAFIQGLSEKDIETTLRLHGIPPEAINNQKVALAALQAAVETKTSLKNIFKFIYGDKNYIYGSFCYPQKFGNHFKRICAEVNQEKSFDIKKAITHHL